MLPSMGLKSENTLAAETSPYLLEHAGNPVHWHAWNATVLAYASEEDKPILLSVGYSACHWCHVMAHESFEDEATAAIMNAHFINIKVDREERPDLDRIYQIAQQILNQRSGGWPLTMFLTPQDHLPFFGGTYFPPEAKFGLPGFKDLLQQIADFYHREKATITQQNQSFRLSLARMEQQLVPENIITLSTEPLHRATQQLKQSFDKQHGGFGGAPKFPHPTNLMHLLRQYLKDSESEETLHMVNFTLQKMALSGLHDQLGGGFYRYSVDDRWQIPHFEKMLYDNGLLLLAYSQAWRFTQTPLFKQAAQGTADWVIREMQDPQGGYYSSLDADSEGQEGKFYVWADEEIKALLTDEEFKLICRCYGLTQAPNFEGKWHLQVTDTEIINDPLVKQAQAKLLQRRNTRIWPNCDDKILCAWNALMIKGMATAAFTFNNEHYLESATRALQFIRAKLWVDGKLLATCRNHKAHLNAYLDDYAFLIDAILALLQCRWDRQWLEMAIQLADQLLDLYADQDHGGFFFTSHDHEKLIQRSKPFMDDSLPAGNGVAACVLAKLGHLLGKPIYLEAAEATLKAAWASINQYPSAHSALLQALDEHIAPSRQIIILGQPEATTIWRDKCRQFGKPFDSLMILPTDPAGLPGLLGKYQPEGEITAYICQGQRCLPPIFDLDIFQEKLLSETRK